MPLAGSILTNGNYCFMEQVGGKGIDGPPTHSPFGRGLYVLEGHCTFNADGETVKAGPGTLVSVSLVEHSFTVDAPNSRLLSFRISGGFEMLLMSLAMPAAERRPPIPGSTRCLLDGWLLYGSLDDLEGLAKGARHADGVIHMAFVGGRRLSGSKIHITREAIESFVQTRRCASSSIGESRTKIGGARHPLHQLRRYRPGPY